MLKGTKIFFFALPFPLILSFLLISCAQVSKPKPAVLPASAPAEAKADAALGTLPAQGKKSEAQKKLQELEAEAASRDAVSEAEKIAREEEQKRLHSSVNDDRLLAESAGRR